MRSRGQLNRAFSRERGVALPVALSVMFVVMALTGVAATSAITATHQSQRDRDAKQALGAARAGVAAAVHRLNTMGPQPGECVKGVVGGGFTIGSPDADGWCETQPEDLGDDASFVARTSPGVSADVKCQSTHTRKVVSSGFAGNASRRVIATVTANSGTVFGECGIVSLRRLNAVDNSYIRGDVVSNGIVAIYNNARLCGDVAASELRILNNSVYECGTVTEDTTEPYRLRKVALPECLGADSPPRGTGCNDNWRIGDPTKDPWEPYQGDPNNIDWNESGVPERELVLKKKSKLTLTGNAYSFCRLALEGTASGDNIGSRLYVAPRERDSVVKIFIEPPENCLDQPPQRKTFLSVIEKAAIVNTNPDPTTLQIYMVGTFDPGRKFGTRAVFDHKPKDVYTNAVIYAPRSRVIFQGFSRLFGAVAGKDIRVKEKARVLWSDDVAKLNGSNFSVLPSFFTGSWSECTPTSLGDTSYIQDCDD